VRITTAARIKNNAWRFDPDTGFLRCTAAILCPGVMTYARAELEDAGPPEGLQQIRMYVSPEELAAPEGIATLEGMPAVVGHTWQQAGALTSCGNIAGAPFIADGHLMAGILVTDPEAVRRTMLPDGDPAKLVEISSAGDWSIIWQPGITPDGQAYDGLFVKLRYNHIALLPTGAGRAGASVRIINEKEAPKMEFTRVQLRMAGGKLRFVRVANEDVNALEEAMTENEEVAKSAITPDQLQAALDELTTLKEETKVKTDRIAELEGMITAYKDQLDAALSPAAVEAAAADMAVENEEATAVMNAAGLQLGADDKRLRGHALRSKVINSVRVKNGKPALTEEELKDEGYVKGMYKAQAEMAGHAQRKPAGHQVVTTTVQNANDKKTPNMANTQDRFDRLYPKAEGK
jgi:hypothetical protein